MPKRSYSFEEHLLPQLKVHVSEKEINSDEKMKSVYEKTKELLFKGANTKANSDLSFTDSLPKTANNDSLRQTYLNNSCQIETHSEKLNPVFEECKSCHATKMVNCQYCDNNLCFSCSVECESCEQMFCKNCIVSEYVGDGEKINCHYCGE